jgi:formimidoylglutamate deiminase
MRFWCSHAWMQSRWQAQVLLEADARGLWSRIEAGVPCAQAQEALRLGPVLPGLVNAHSHAFQRAMAGLGERLDPQAPQDDFWSWRERMYRVARAISPEALETIAAWLYTELLGQGYTQVCEFHYLHRAPGGAAYADPQAMSWALVRAAERTGMGLTLLPTLYVRPGFEGGPLQPGQARFAGTADFIMDTRERVLAHARQQGRQGLLHAGLALHSLRAVAPEAVLELARTCSDGPIHIHAAEQPNEVAQCLQHLGARPVQWLLDHAGLGPNWHLVHATHIDAQEMAGLAASGAGVVLCPSTEANLGDGLWPLPSGLEQAVPWSIGTDSHVGRSWSGELRCLEYGQRLQLQRRNVAGRHGGLPSSAAVLFEQALAGGSRASGLPLAGIALGQRADLQEVDTGHPALLGLPVDCLLDACVFSEPGPRPRRTWVAGRPVATDLSPLAAGWQELLARLWPGERAGPPLGP